MPLNLAQTAVPLRAPLGCPSRAMTSIKGKKTTKSAASGGKAEAAGSNYETLVGTWYCYTLLLGSRMQPLFDLPASTEVTSLQCQTDAPVDDVNAGTFAGGQIFVQAKRTVVLSAAKASAFARAKSDQVEAYPAFLK